MEAQPIAPVLVLSTGRCGSTMLSEVLNTHPAVLSLSEFFASVGTKALARKRLGGKALWKICQQHSPGLKAMLAGEGKDRTLYPFDAPDARFTPKNVPSILCRTLPHLTTHFESLYDEFEGAVAARPKAALADQYRFMFDWLRERLGRRVWVERSGGSLLFGHKLITLFSRGTGVPHLPRRKRHRAIDAPASRLQGRARGGSEIAPSGGGPVRRRPAP